MNETLKRIISIMQRNVDEAFSEAVFGGTSSNAVIDDVGLSLDAITICEAQKALGEFKPQLLIELHESGILLVVNYVWRTWRERLLSWPWAPWRSKRREYLPDPNIYRFDGPPGVEMWVCHPQTSKRVRELAQQNGVAL